MKAILFDLDGVFYQGDVVIPGAAETVAWVQQHSIPHLFVTNTTSRPRSSLLEKLSAMHIKTDEAHLFTPIIAAKTWLQSAGIKDNIALHIPEKTKIEFTEYSESIERPEAIIIGDLGEGWDYKVLNHIFRLLMENPDCPLIALGMNRYWQAEDGLRLDVAPFIKALEYASNRQALIMGKPDVNFFHAAIEKLGLSASDMLMIGDDINGDIAAAQQSGLTAWLVRTGKFRLEDLQLDIHPDRVITSVAELPKYWE